MNVEWNRGMMLEVEMIGDVFLRIKETLERIGIADFKNNRLEQVCQILSKRDKYYIISNSELMTLDGNGVVTSDDLARRNRIATLLQEWNMIKIISDCPVEEREERIKLFVLKHSDVDEWNLTSSYHIGEEH